MADTPNSYKDPYWSDLASKAEAKSGVPAGLLVSIINNGERSNKNQVSEAGAKTVFQIIPATRKLILDKYGIDPYLNDENAAEGAALLLKESLDRNKGDVSAAAAEYHGGTNRANWGPKTKAYVNRVVGGAESVKADTLSEDFGKWVAQSQGTTEQIDKVKQLQQDFGKTMAESSTASQKPAEASGAVKEDSSPEVDQLSSDFGQWAAQKQAEPAKPKDLGIIGGIQEAVTGNLRATPESRSLPEWTGMPELNQLSMASAKTGLGTMFAAPDEVVQVIKANFPGAQIRQDEKGNYIIKSSVDAKDYVIPPGLTIGDLPRVIGGLAAFTPAGRATSIAGSALTTAGTQAAIEGTQAATGGDFDPASVAVAGLVGAAAPPLLKGLEAVGGVIANPIKGAVNKVLGREAAPLTEAASVKAATSAVPETAVPVRPTIVPEAPVAAPATDIYAATRSATSGKEAAVADLAAASAPNAKTLKAAKDLEIEGYLQPDHVSTNQEFIELSQVLKSIQPSQMAILEKEGLAKVAKRADDLISELGGTDDLAGISNKIKVGLSETNSKLKADAKKIYDEIDAKLVKGAVSAPAPKTLAFVNQRAKELGGIEGLTAGEKNILRVLAPAGEKEPTYGLLDQIRKEVGNAKRNSQNSFGTSDSKLLGDLEDVLRADQGAVANAHGLGQKWEVARGLTRTYKGVQDDLTALFGKTIDGSIVGDLSGAVTALPKGDPSKFIKLIKSTPEDMRQELTASGLATAFSKNKGGLNFNSYTQWFEGLLKNKQSYTALMANLPPNARKSLTDLYRVSKGINRSISTKIPTGRLSESVKKLEGVDSLMGKILDAAKYDLKANLIAGAAGTATGMVGGPVAGIGVGHFLRNALSKGTKLPGVQAAEKLLVSPDFQAAVQQYARGEAKPAATKLAKSPIFVDFVKKAKITDLKSLSARERWILQALEANQQQQVNSR